MKKFIMSVAAIIMSLSILVSNADAFTWGSNTTLLTNTNLYWPATSLAKPGYLATAIDPTFGTKITRVSGDPGTNITTAGGTVLGKWGTTTRHNYSLDAAWNSDESMLLLALNSGCGSPPLSDGFPGWPNV